MKKMTCYVDFHLRGPGVFERTQAFNNLCLLLILLRVFDMVELRCINGSGHTKMWTVDWSKIRPRK